MPIREILPPSRSPEFQSILEDLEAELRHPREVGQPMITIRHMGNSGLTHVHVIWDRWAGCPDVERPNIVREAFAKVRGDEFEQSIALAAAATVSEAVEIGLLPFRIIPLLRKGDPVTREQCAQAMRDEGASVLEDPRNPILAFGTEEEAMACLDRLQKRLPGPYWTLVKDLGGPSP